MSNQWQHKDFVWEKSWIRQSQASADSTGWLRTEVWSHARSEILAELQKWSEDGWEPVVQVGPECWELERFEISAFTQWNIIHWIFWFISLLPSFGLTILFLFQRFTGYRPVAFRVPMRRRVA